MSNDDELRRGRDGDLYPVVDEPATPPHVCRNGWLTPASADAQVPCLVCKEHLIRRHLEEQTDPAVAERGRELVRQELEAAAARRAPL